MCETTEKKEEATYAIAGTDLKQEEFTKLR